MPVARRYIEQAWYAISLDKSLPTPVEYVHFCYSCMPRICNLPFCLREGPFEVTRLNNLNRICFNSSRFNAHSLFHFTIRNPKLNNSNSFQFGVSEDLNYIKCVLNFCFITKHY